MGKYFERLQQPQMDQQLSFITTGGSPSISSVSDSDSMPLFNSFQLFPKLPAELRLKIWRLAVLGDRRTAYLSDEAAVEPNHDCRCRMEL